MFAKGLLASMVIGCIVAVVLGAFGLHYSNGYAWLHILVTIVSVSLFLWFQESRSRKASRSTHLVIKDSKGTVLAKIADGHVVNNGVSLVSVHEDGSVLITHGGSDTLVVTGTCRGNLVTEGNVTIKTVSTTGDLVQHN